MGEIRPYRKPFTLEIQRVRLVGLDVQYVPGQVARLESGVRQCKPTPIYDSELDTNLEIDAGLQCAGEMVR